MPPTLGQRLKHAREKRGLSLRDLEHTTKVPVARLQDLEDDKLNTFGGMTYAKAFLRTYSNMLEVNADAVLSQMQAPPLGGVRDYRYLVESHGRWVPDKFERHHTGPALPTVGPGKSFAFAAMVCGAFGLLIGGGVLANAFFSAKPPPSAPGGEKTVTGPAVSISGGAPGEASSLSRDTFLPPDEIGDDREFTIFGVNLTLLPDKVAEAPVPRAIPVPAERFPTRAVPPKAEAVR